MSTQIKKNGNWVTVAGGTRMWVGTKAALQAALDAGELVDGTAVMVTDDYEEEDSSGTGTPASGIGTVGGKVRWTKHGRMVHVTCSNISHSGAIASIGVTPWFTGLPKPVMRSYFTCLNETTLAAGFIALGTEGNIIADYNTIDANTQVYVSFTYMSAE